MTKADGRQQHNNQQTKGSAKAVGVGGGDSGSGDDGYNGINSSGKDNGSNSNGIDINTNYWQLFFLPVLPTVGPSEGTIAHVIHSDKNDGPVA